MLASVPKPLEKGKPPIADAKKGAKLNGVRVSALLQRTTWWCHVTVLKYNCNEKLWMPYEHRAAEMSRRVVTLNQLVTAIPVAELAKFITCKSPNGRKQYTLSDAGVRFVISQANLAHHLTP